MAAVDPRTPQDDETTKQLMWMNVKDFLGYTTAHGCGRLIAAKKIWFRVFWIVLCVGAHVAFWYQTYVLMVDYAQKPISTRISMEHAEVWSLNPTITIDSLSPFIHPNIHWLIPALTITDSCINNTWFLHFFKFIINNCIVVRQCDI